MRNAGLDEAQTGIKIAGSNVNDLRFADDTTLMAEIEELKNRLMTVKEESEKAGLKLNIQKTKIMASSPITSWQMDIMADFIFLGCKVSADGDCSHEIKRCLLLGRKAMTNLDSILKSRAVTLPIKVHLVKATVFPVKQCKAMYVWMWGLDYKENWVLKNWGFWTVLLEKTLESPVNCKEIKQVNPKGNKSVTIKVTFLEKWLTVLLKGLGTMSEWVAPSSHTTQSLVTKYFFF